MTKEEKEEEDLAEAVAVEEAVTEEEATEEVEDSLKNGTQLPN